MFTENACWCWRLDNWGELREKMFVEKVFVIHWAGVRKKREAIDTEMKMRCWVGGAGSQEQ